jgi:hypothetical protein
MTFWSSVDAGQQPGIELPLRASGRQADIK